MTFWEWIAIVDLTCQLLILAGLVNLILLRRSRLSSFQRQISEMRARFAELERGIR